MNTSGSGLLWTLTGLPAATMGVMVYGERNWPINLYQNDRSPRRPSNVAARIPPQQIYHKFVPWQIYYKFVPQFSGLLI